MGLNGLRETIETSLVRQVGRASGHLQQARELPIDILEDESSYLVVCDVPGCEPTDVQVRYLSGRIRVDVTRFREFRERFEMRFPGRGMSLAGEVDLPPDATVDPEAATARLSAAGTIRIELPKHQEPPANVEAMADDEPEEVAVED